MAVLAISSCAKQENGDEQKDVNLAETFSVWPSYENIDYDFLQDYEMPEMKITVVDNTELEKALYDADK